MTTFTVTLTAAQFARLSDAVELAETDYEVNGAKQDRATLGRAWSAITDAVANGGTVADADTVRMPSAPPAVVAAVVDAWTVPGPLPAHHHASQMHLHRSWPSLAGAVAALASAVRSGHEQTH